MSLKEQSLNRLSAPSLALHIPNLSFQKIIENT